jgi:hypothetical protein
MLSAMPPSEYYVAHFREHFASFWRSLAVQGSVSRARRNAYGPRPNQQTIEYFSVVDLLRDPQRDFPDHLQGISAEFHLDFMAATCYTILIDQVMYPHFKAAYPAFRAMTMYPKMDRTVGPARTFMMANPFEVFAEDILRSRSIELTTAVAKFTDWSTFIAKDLSLFLNQNSQLSVSWPDLCNSMLNVPSCSWGAFGAQLHDALLLQRSAA